MTLGDDTLTGAEVQSLLGAESGLLSLRGRWVEINREQLKEVLDHWKKIEKVFPTAVSEGQDVAEIGAIKVRFGSPHVRQRLIFEAHLTRYKSERAPVLQESLGGF